MPQKFYITKTRYIQQVGDREPKVVQASAGIPALVTLSDDFEPSKWDKCIYRAKPPEPKPAHAGLAPNSVAKMHERDEEDKKAAKKDKKEKRAADR